MRQIILIAHDIRSTHNVGSLLRTAEGLGVEKVYFTGYTPHPRTEHDNRLPHVTQKLESQIHKTALGAEKSQSWEYQPRVIDLIKDLQAQNFTITALEQTKSAIPLPDYQPPDKIALLLGREVEGIDQSLLDLCNDAVVIPMFGQKESFNVVQAAAMVLYHCRFA